MFELDNCDVVSNFEDEISLRGVECNIPPVTLELHQSKVRQRTMFMEFKYGREWFLCIISVIGFMYQSQVKHVWDKGHFSIFAQGVYKSVWPRLFHYAKLFLSLNLS